MKYIALCDTYTAILWDRQIQNSAFCIPATSSKLRGWIWEGEKVGPFQVRSAGHICPKIGLSAKIPPKNQFPPSRIALGAAEEARACGVCVAGG